VPAHADTAPGQPIAPASTTATATAPEAPTAPVVAGPAVAVTQLGVGNVDLSVRIASPGDNGAVTQVVSAGADASQTEVQSADTQQTASSNVNISIRIASPGADGPVTQTIDAAADASTTSDPQYQPPDSQYQASATAPTPTQPMSAPTTSTPAPPPTIPAPAAPAPATSSLPTAWNWTWTWTCGDITGGSTKQTIDTGIQGWVWTWNMGSTCVQLPTLTPPIQSVNPTELAGSILLPTLTPPVTPAIEPPTPPTPPTPPLIQAAPVVVQVVALPAAPAAELSLEGTQASLVPLAQLELPQVEPAAPQPLTVPAAAALPSVAVTFTAAETVHPVQSRPETTTSPRHRPAELPVPPPLPLSLDAPTAPASAGGGGAGGSGVAAALVLWLLVQFPGTAVLRRPPRHRTPRARVDDIRNRPG
jgi:hypothetical protein